MKIYLLRHAERGHGKKQDTLTKKGIKQSEDIVKDLEILNIDKIICAETKRTKRTIEPFLKKFSGKIEYTNLVNEQEMGKLFGKSGQEYREALEKSGLDKKEFRPEKGENYYDLINRAKKFINLLKKEETRNILISSHAGFIREFIKLLVPLQEELKPNFGSIIFIELDKEFNVINYNQNFKL